MPFWALLILVVFDHYEQKVNENYSFENLLQFRPFNKSLVLLRYLSLIIRANRRPPPMGVRK